MTAMQVATGTTLPRLPLPAAEVSVGDLIDLYLYEKDKARGGREIAGGATWRASKLGYCLRAQYLEFFLKAPTLWPLEPRMRRVFEVGHMTGDFFLEAFDALGVLIHPTDKRGAELDLHDPDLDIGAHVDAVIGGEIRPTEQPLLAKIRAALIDRYGPVLPVLGLEFKSVQSKSFWWAKKEGTTVASPAHLIQAATYDLLSKKQGINVDEWRVTSMSKDDLTIAETSITEFHRRAALERIEALNRSKTEGPPPCTCIGQDEFKPKQKAWSWKICGYYRGSPESRKKKTEGSRALPPDGPCCVVEEEN